MNWGKYLQSMQPTRDYFPKYTKSLYNSITQNQINTINKRAEDLKRHFSKEHMLLLLLSCFSHVQLCATPYTAAHQAPPSLGFSRQEHLSKYCIAVVSRAGRVRWPNANLSSNHILPIGLPWMVLCAPQIPMLMPQAPMYLYLEIGSSGSNLGSRES